MASGHEYRSNEAEHMAAPTMAAPTMAAKCQPGAVHTWPRLGLQELSAFSPLWKV